MTEAATNNKARVAALAKVSNNGYDLKSVGKVFQNDEGVVRLAVSRNGIALQFASEELRNNKNIVISALMNSAFALQYASEALQKDKDVVRIASLRDSAERKYPSLEFASTKVKEDKTAVLAAVTKNGYNLAFASDSLREDPDVILSAYQQLGIKQQPNTSKDAPGKRAPSKKTPQTVAKEKVMSVEGTGIQLRYAKITKRVFDRVSKNGITCGELDELLDGGGVEGGALFPLTGGKARVFKGSATLCFDNGISDKSLAFNAKLALKIPSKIECDILADAKYMIIAIDQMDGIWARWESKMGFDPDLLGVSLDIHKLADGTLFPMLSLLYDGDDGTCGMDLNGIGTHVYVLTNNGSGSEVEIL